MTNEDKAFAFANKNADKYINDEDTLDALRDGFLCGAEWKDQQFKEYLEKLREEFTDEEAGYYVLSRIINELFKED